MYREQEIIQAAAVRPGDAILDTRHRPPVDATVLGIDVEWHANGPALARLTLSVGGVGEYLRTLAPTDAVTRYLPPGVLMEEELDAIEERARALQTEADRMPDSARVFAGDRAHVEQLLKDYHRLIAEVRRRMRYDWHWQAPS